MKTALLVLIVAIISYLHPQVEPVEGTENQGWGPNSPYAVLTGIVGIVIATSLITVLLDVLHL